MEVTLQNIADELELSRATVSRSLRDDQRINPTTRARVYEAAGRMGYNGQVRRTRRTVESTNRSITLGLLTRFGTMVEAQGDQNLMKMMAGIMSVADEQGALLQIHTLKRREDRPNKEAALIPLALQDGGPKAIIAHGGQDEEDLDFLAHRVPVVSMSRTYQDLPIDAAVADNVDGIHRLVRHLVELGHRQLAWVSPEYRASFINARKTGFIEGCVAHNLGLGSQTFFGREIYQSSEAGSPIQDKGALLTAVNAGVTGFVCGNDSVAFRVIGVLKAAGLRVPEDVSVTGFDAWSKIHPADVQTVTSIDPQFFEMGQVAARLALQRIANPLPQPCIVSVRGRLVIGDTTGPAPETSPTHSS